MSAGSHAQDLRAQLDALCGKRKLSEDALLEIAALAGLLARAGEHHPTAEALRGRTAALLRGIGDEVLDSLADEVEESDELADESDAWDRFTAFDEVAAAFAWAGAAARIAPYATRVAENIAAFPETWSPLAPRASEVLARASPLPDEPALRVWRAIAMASAQEAPAPPSTAV